MNTATQHISIVQGAANKLQDVERRILKETGITHDQYTDMILDIGMQFARQFVTIYISRREYIYTNLVTNPEWSYWNWWRLHWLRDDAMMLQIGACLKNNYREKKEAMIGEDLMVKDLYWMIQNHTDEV